MNTLRSQLFYALFGIIGMLTSYQSIAQTYSLSGKITSEGKPVEFVNVYLKATHYGTSSDLEGKYLLSNIPEGNYTVVVSAIGYEAQQKKIEIAAHVELDFDLIATDDSLDAVVISGTMREVSKLESPVPVEVYTSKFFRRNPNPSVFEALQHINGIRPQINCSVCNTGDIHTNGLEGPYTMILIDGMPIVSGLSTVYGLSGIPQALIERVEIVKGPASTLYGSEAVGGLINIITKNPDNAPAFSADVYGTTWGEFHTDLAGRFKAGKNAQSLLGLNYFNYSIPIDNNDDGFTDVTLQHRISLFNKWSFRRPDNRIFSFAARAVYEDRWGGEMDWKKRHRGGDEVYGESIYTGRWEVFGTYQLPLDEKILLQFSANGHHQNSAYGDEMFLADQKIGFGQLTWSKTLGKHQMLTGLAYRYTYYDDNTPATAAADDITINKSSHMHLPGVFVQDEIKVDEANTLLLGMRYDYNSVHGSIFSPRLNYKWVSSGQKDILRFSIGNGYRVASVFTEDHAALTGSREVVFLADLQPETSWNANVNYVKKLHAQNGTSIALDASVFYTHFFNKIIPDYETNPTQIIYDNLNGHAVSQGVSLNVDIVTTHGISIGVGGTLMDVHSVENGIKERELFSERFSGVWNVGYTFPDWALTVDYTGNIYSPMRLPLISENDPRREYSPWWSVQNIQLTKTLRGGFELYGGVKNLLNWTPAKSNPFLIARTDDPFDKSVVFDPNGQPVVTPDNPYGLKFDPEYMYAPNQGIRGFLGFRYTLR